MQLINGVVLGVGSQSGTSKSTGRPYTRFDIQFSDGRTYVTFDAAKSGTAVQLQGQPVSLLVTVSQRGNFTDYRLEEIGPEGSLSLPEGVENTSNGFTPQNNFQRNDDDNKRRSKEEVKWENAILAAAYTTNDANANITEIEHRARQIYELMKTPPTNQDVDITPEEIAATVPNTNVGADRDW